VSRNSARRARGAILHATDFSAASRPALARAIEFARREGARLVVLHVMTPPSPLVSGPHPATWIDLLARARRAAERRLAAVVARARRSAGRVESRLIEGMPAETIARVAQKERASLVVIGTHGRSGLGRVFMGSVAARVLALCRCPVLTVRERRRRG